MAWTKYGNGQVVWQDSRFCDQKLFWPGFMTHLLPYFLILFETLFHFFPSSRRKISPTNIIFLFHLLFILILRKKIINYVFQAIFFSRLVICITYFICYGYFYTTWMGSVWKIVGVRGCLWRNLIQRRHGRLVMWNQELQQIGRFYFFVD